MNKKRFLLYLVFSFAFSWLLALGFYLTGERWVTSRWAQLVGMVYMYIPFLSVVIVEKIIYKGSLKESIGLSFKFNGWFIVAWLLPFFIVGLSFLISLLMPGVSFSPDLQGFFERYRDIMGEEQINLMKSQAELLGSKFFIIVIVQALIAGITINAIFAFGEEAGWRGFLIKEFGKMGFWKASYLIGFIWGVWHAPIIAMGHNYPQHPGIGVIMMILFCLLYSPIFTYIRIKTKSVLGAAILHGSLNATAGIPLMYLKGGNDLTVGIGGLAGLLVLFLLNLLLLFDMSLKNRKSLSELLD